MTEDMGNGIEKNVFNLEGMQKYFSENSYKFSEKFKPSNKGIKCIDDRSGEPHSLERIGLPGAGLGILAAVLRALYLIEKKYLTILPVDYNKIAKDIEGIIGVSLHTDEKNAGDSNASVCAGCGHIVEVLDSPDKLSKRSMSFLKNEYLEELKEKHKNGKIEVPAYKGKHNGKAIVIVKDLKNGLKSRGGGDQVYVYNEAWHEKILADVSFILSEDLKQHIPQITREETSEFLLEAAGSQLTATIKKLAPDLPVFLVYEDTIQEKKVEKTS